MWHYCAVLVQETGGSPSSVNNSDLRKHSVLELSKQHFRTTVLAAEQQKEMGFKYDSFFKNEKKRVLKYMNDECKRQRTAGLGEAEAQTKAIEEAGAGKFRIKKERE